jgi:hypothetical protein
VRLVYAIFDVPPIVFVFVALATTTFVVSACFRSRWPTRVPLIALLTCVILATPFALLIQFQDSNVPRPASYWYWMAGYFGVVVLTIGSSVLVLLRSRPKEEHLSGNSTQAHSG